MDERKTTAIVRRICPYCKEGVDKVALTELLYTWEPDGGYLIETPWHKVCYAAAAIAAAAARGTR